MKNYKNIIYVDTVYSLLLTFLLEPDIDNNLYLLNDKFPENITKNIKNKIILKTFDETKIKIIKYIKIRYFLKKIKKILDIIISNKKNFYIQDHIEYSQFFLNNYSSNFILIEDGILNYRFENMKNKKMTFHRKLKRNFVYLAKENYENCGRSEKIKKIYLTGIMSIPDIISMKVEKINIEEKWNKLQEEKKEKILKIYNINLEKLRKDKSEKILLLTQPFSEINFLTEKEKINMYKEILKKETGKKIYIKMHPIEKTNYAAEFKSFNVEILEKDFPIELIGILELDFFKVITICSTAAYNFREKYNIDFLGTEFNKKLFDKIGRIEF